MMPFEGYNFYRIIVNSASLPFRKTGAYELLKNPRYHLRRFLLYLATQEANFFYRLINEQKEKVLIFDDSIYYSSRSRVVEFLAWFYGHKRGASLERVQCAHSGLPDGTSFLQLDHVVYPPARI